MPIVKIEMLAGRDAATKERIAVEITDVIARNTGAEPAHIYVMFSDVAPGDWAVAGRLFAPPPAPSGTER
ncbi:4-oxalocrotonate tautomerase family protein [Ramlibacter sp. AW1]|uniref:4-oxalocrotonate tautomerase family protein n=1 Tax=Ramlibacter aurantiacus TaxID=2801330 RepID=A0A936ZPF4_9BURK|nr:4-oxalocrotonate tautomerase family protein [Ramlibacter aurantiacus]MBL0421090.1 4-oxalocrotonate tautomerase family protein [Ramlibacter aurantiacus]